VLTPGDNVYARVRHRQNFLPATAAQTNKMEINPKHEKMENGKWKRKDLSGRKWGT
jgi:uncharacterized membrane protein